MAADVQLNKGHTQYANEYLEAKAKIRIPGEASQVLGVIERLTWGWKKKYDHISRSQFMEMTGMNKSAVERGLKKLKQMNMITWRSGGYFGPNKNYDTWIQLPKKLPLNTSVYPSIQGKATPQYRGKPPLNTGDTKERKKGKKRDIASDAANGKKVVRVVNKYPPQKVTDESSPIPPLETLYLELWKERWWTDMPWSYGKDRAILKRLVKQAHPTDPKAGAKMVAAVIGDFFGSKNTFYAKCKHSTECFNRAFVELLGERYGPRDPTGTSDQEQRHYADKRRSGQSSDLKPLGSILPGAPDGDE